MKLEDEIQQKSFRNEFHKLAVNIIFTHGWLADKYNKEFKRFDLTGSQFNILRILRGQYPASASVNLLKDRMLDKMSDVSRLVERLRKKGLLKRNICPKDRRKVDVVITEKGLKLLAEFDKLDSEFDKFFSNITEDEAALLNNLMDKIRN